MLAYTTDFCLFSDKTHLKLDELVFLKIFYTDSDVLNEFT